MEKDKEQSNLSRTLEDLLKKDKSDLSKKTIEDLLKKIYKRTDDLSDMQKRMERQAREQAKAQGKGIIGQTIAAAKAGSKTEEQYQIVKKGIKSGKRKFFKTLFGDVGDWVDVFEEKASEEEIAASKKALGMDKEKKKATTTRKSSAAMSSKKLSSILKNTADIKKTIQKIEKVLTKTSLRAGFEFDPRLGTKGGFRETATGKIASKEAATTTPTADRLGKLISADEEPIIQLKEQFDNFEKKTNDTLNIIKGKIESAIFSLNGLTPTLGVMSVHDKLNAIMAKSTLSELDVDVPDDVDGPDDDVLDRDKKTKPDKPKKPGKPDVPKKGRLGRLGRIGQVLSRARTAATMVTGTAAVAAGGALAVTGGGLYALDKGMTDIGKEGMSKMSELESKYGLKPIYDKGMAIGYEVQGKKYGLNDLPQEYKDLIDAYGPGDKRSFAARSALKKIQENPEKYKALEISSVEPTTAPETSLLESPAGAAVGVAPAATSVVAPPSPTPPPAEEKKSFGAIVSGAISAAYSGVKKFLGFESPTDENLSKYVKLKDSSVNLDGLNDQMKSRLAGLAKDYYDQTGQKIQINSGYRSPEEQAELFAKYGPPRAAPPGRSRHESGLAVDINSSDANKAIELGLMSKYGFTRPVSGETWHIEPIETAKRGGTPDNPYKPGDPIVAANDGKEVNPKTGTKPSGAVIADRLPDSGATPAAGLGPAGQPRGPGMQIADSGYVAPVASTVGTQVAGGSAALETSKMTARATPPAPVIINNQSGNQQPIQPPKTPLPKASAINTNTTYARAFAQDFAHPSSFTSVGLT